jgi:hypothetical protein
MNPNLFFQRGARKGTRFDQFGTEIVNFVGIPSPEGCGAIKAVRGRFPFGRQVEDGSRPTENWSAVLIWLLLEGLSDAGIEGQVADNE